MRTAQVDLTDHLVDDSLGQVLGVSDIMLGDIGCLREAPQFVLQPPDHR
jgi:hypothetical protein